MSDDHIEEAERIILGALMGHPDLIEEVIPLLTSADFQRLEHGAVYAAITANAGLGEPTTPLAIAMTLDKFGELDRLPSGSAYLDLCTAAVPAVASITWYARQIAERSYARRAEVAATKLRLVAAKGGREEIANALDQLQQDLAKGPERAGPEWRSRLGNGASFIYDAPDKVPAVWGDGDEIAWAAGESLMIAGPQGVGKTTLAGQIIMGRLGLIPEVLGLPVVPGRGRVLYLAMDRPQQASRSLRRLARPEWRDVIHDRLTVWQGPPPADFALSATVLLEMCRAAESDTVVIDSVKDSAVGISKDEVGAGYNRCRQTAIAAGVEVLELHHQRKSGEGGGKPTSLADVYGSTWITGGAGSVILLWGEPGDSVVEFKHLKQPMEPVGPMNVIHDHHAGTSHVDQDDSRNLIIQAGRRPSGLTAKTAAEALFGKANPTQGEVEKARRKLEAYVRTGSMHCRPGVRGGGPGRAESTYFLVERREAA